MKGKLLSCFAMMLLSVTAFAQLKTVKGTVTDNTGLGVIGASVVEKGTNNGVIADIDGNFAISVQTGATLEVSSIGYKTVEIVVGSQDVYNIKLEDDQELLDEVVVVGYGTMKKSDLSGASVSMKEDDLKGSIISSLDQSLQGRAAGVAAVQTSGAPGSSSSIRVRGQATVNANAEPLYVIDGVIVQGSGSSASSYGLAGLGNGRVSTISPLATINPADIVSMEILKDASATAIYGAQGANGVILITTKHGKAGEAKFTYDGMFAVSRQTTRIKMLDLRQYAEYHNDWARIGEVEASPYYTDPSLLGRGTNWQDEVFRTALQHQHQLSAQGGTDKVQYYISGSYMDQDGTVIGTKFNRFSVRTNIDAQLKKWMKLGVNATYARTKDDLKLADEPNTNPSAIGASAGVEWNVISGEAFEGRDFSNDAYAIKDRTFHVPGGLNVSYEFYYCSTYMYNRAVDAGKFTSDFQVNSNVSMRGELQYLYTPHFDGQWLFALYELTLYRCLTLSADWLYNIGHAPEATNEHFYSFSATYTNGAHRLSLGYTKTREGFHCAGGVCRFIPRQQGLTLSYNFSW